MCSFRTGEVFNSISNVTLNHFIFIAKRFNEGFLGSDVGFLGFNVDFSGSNVCFSGSNLGFLGRLPGFEFETQVFSSSQYTLYWIGF